MNKPCYNDSFCLHEYSKMIGLKRKRHLFGVEKLKWFLLLRRIDILAKCFRIDILAKNTFAYVQEQKKAMSPQYSAYIPSSVKSPLKKPIVLHWDNKKIHITFSITPPKLKISLSRFIFIHRKYIYFKRRIHFLSNHCTCKK